MDIIFNCPKCEQQLEVDSGGAGSEVDGASCGETVTIAQAGCAGTRSHGPDSSGSIPAVAGGQSMNPMATSAAAKVEMHLKVPVRKSSESLIAKPLQPL